MAQRAADAEGVGIDAIDAKEQTALRVDGRALSLEVTYAVKRLVKGLASSREGSRQGFTLALCLLLRTIPDLDGARLFTLVHDLLPIKGGGMSDSEIKDNNFGRLFACMALIFRRACGRRPSSKRRDVRAALAVRAAADGARAVVHGRVEREVAAADVPHKLRDICKAAVVWRPELRRRPNS